MKWGAYYVIDHRDVEPTAPVIAWLTEHQVSPVSGLPRVELKFPTGLSGIVVDVDSDDPDFEDADGRVSLPTEAGVIQLQWAGPPREEDGELLLMLEQASRELAEDLVGLDSVDEVQKAIYDWCCAEYPS